MALNNIAVVNCSSDDDKYRLVSMLIGSAVDCQEKITPWPLKTKYYDVVVSLHAFDEDGFRQSCNDGATFTGVVLHCNDVQQQRFRMCWADCVNPKMVDIRLLVCDAVPDDCDATLQQWCVENKFELIDLYPSDESQHQAQGETVGIHRVAEALRSYDWTHGTRDSGSAADGDHFDDFFSKFSEVAANAKTLDDERRRELSANAILELINNWGDRDLPSDSSDD